MNKSRRKYIESCEISEVKEVVLAGYKQKIAIEGKRKNLPVVLCLHGGPGSPVPFSVGCRGMFPDFTDRAVMVYWDQLGCGINNFPIDDGFTIESFVGRPDRGIKVAFPRKRSVPFRYELGQYTCL